MESCPICFETFRSTDNIIIVKHQDDTSIEVSRRRGHYFHRKCIERWKAEGHETCPMDRDPLGRLYTVPGYKIVKFDLQDYDNDYGMLLQRTAVNSTLVDIIEDINQTDKYRRTLAYYACRFGNYALAVLLIRRGADFNMPTGNSGFTPLMCAVCYNHVNIVHKLLMTPAVLPGLSVHDQTGTTAFQYACRYGYVSIINDFLLFKLVSKEEVANMYDIMQERYHRHMLFGDEIIAKMLAYLL